MRADRGGDVVGALRARKLRRQRAAGLSSGPRRAAGKRALEVRANAHPFGGRGPALACAIDAARQALRVHHHDVGQACGERGGGFVHCEEENGDSTRPRESAAAARILPFAPVLRYDRPHRSHPREGALMFKLPVSRAACALAAILAILVTTADAKTLRWANRGDMQTTDPHSQNEGLTNNINSLIYEFLTDRDKQLGLRPSLAESWQRINETTWRGQ